MRSAILFDFIFKYQKGPFFLGILCIAISFVATGIDVGFTAMEGAHFRRGDRNLL